MPFSKSSLTAFSGYIFILLARIVYVVRSNASTSTIFLTPSRRTFSKGLIGFVVKSVSNLRRIGLSLSLSLNRFKSSTEIDKCTLRAATISLPESLSKPGMHSKHNTNHGWALEGEPYVDVGLFDKVEDSQPHRHSHSLFATKTEVDELSLLTPSDAKGLKDSSDNFQHMMLDSIITTSSSKSTKSPLVNPALGKYYDDVPELARVEVFTSDMERLLRDDSWDLDSDELGDLWNWENDEIKTATCNSENHTPAPSSISMESTTFTAVADQACEIKNKLLLEEDTEKLQSSPTLLSGLLKILQGAHWEYKKFFDHFSRENGAHMHAENDNVIVAFRGSATFWDVVADLNFGMTKGPHGARMHKGFVHVLDDIDKDRKLIDEVKALVKTSGAKRVVVTGYSLGAAVATMFLLKHGEELLSEGIDVRAITFGAPRIIDQRDLVKLPFILTSRVVNIYTEGDPIPLPLTALVPWLHIHYAHVGNAVTIQDKGLGVKVMEQDDQVKVENELEKHINWLKVDKWDRHLTESYTKFLKLTAVQLNFHLIMEGSPSFFGYHMCRSASCSAAMNRHIQECQGATVHLPEQQQQGQQQPNADQPIVVASQRALSDPMILSSFAGFGDHIPSTDPASIPKPRPHSWRNAFLSAVHKSAARTHVREQPLNELPIESGVFMVSPPSSGERSAMVIPSVVETSSSDHGVSSLHPAAKNSIGSVANVEATASVTASAAAAAAATATATATAGQVLVNEGRKRRFLHQVIHHTNERARRPIPVHMSKKTHEFGEPVHFRTSYSRSSLAMAPAETAAEAMTKTRGKDEEDEKLPLKDDRQDATLATIAKTNQICASAP